MAIAEEISGTDAFLKGYVGNGIAAFTAGYARHTCHLAVARDPVPGEPWHAHVIGKKRPKEEVAARWAHDARYPA